MVAGVGFLAYALPSHYKFGLWDTAVLGLLLSLTDTSCSLRLLTLLTSLLCFHLDFPRWAKPAQLLLCFSPCPSLASAAWTVGLLRPATPVPHVQVAPGGHASCCVDVQLGFWEILEVAPHKAEDGVQSSSECLINTSRISGHP